MDKLKLELRAFFESNKKEKSDISEHLETLYNYIKNSNARVIVELGVRSGKSTSALLLGTIDINAKLYSCDINEPQGTINKFLLLEDYWKFEKSDSVIFASSFDLPVDIVFIDTSHTFEHTLAELEVMYPLIVKDGLFILHDTHNLEYKGTYAATKVFMDRHINIILEKEFENNNGLTILRKI